MAASNLKSDDYYAILGCSRNADDATLKKAYRKLAVKWHPDKNPGDEQATRNFQKISEAYDALSDSKKRRIYDQYGAEGVSQADQMGEDGASHFRGGHGGGGGGMPGGFGFGGPGGGGHGSHMSPQDADHIFSQFFGHSDPFGGNMGGGPGISFSRSGPRGRAQQQQQQVDPFIMFGGGMPGGGMGGARPGGGMRSSQRREPKRFDAIPRGTVVSFKGLVGRPEMNGDQGQVHSYDAQAGRYVVIVEDTDEPLRVKPSNLLQHVHVRIHDVQSQATLNGLKGTIIAWSEEKERYNIYVMDQSKVVSLKPGNIILDNETVVKISGLMAKPELNGKYGTIKSWARDSNRYDIQLSADQIIRVKVENVRV